MTPGQFRSRPEEEVQVGRHQPPSAPRVAAFMEHFEKRYGMAPLGAGQRIIAMAAAHHRFNYIHPFLDGNGRVSRLMSHAMALQAGIGAHGLWSISRGLARGRPHARGYMSMMNHADMPRQGDLDGRGNLSMKALQEFTEWFLEVCLDQITYMSCLFQLETLQDRLKVYGARREFEPAALQFLNQVLHRGEVPRGEIGPITGLKERRARDLLFAYMKL
jgi:Fic family protein